MICKEKHTSYCQGCYFWGDDQVIGYGRLKKKVQGKYMLNEKQSLTCWSWCRGQLLFLHQFLRFLLLLMLHNSGKLAIHHDNMFLLLHIMHHALFKSVQHQGEMRISGRADLPFVQNVFVVIYFQPSVLKSCPPCAATIQQGFYCYWWQVKTLCWYMALYGYFHCLGRCWAMPLTS